MSLEMGEFWYTAQQLEAVKKLRISTQTQRSHLLRNRKCLNCGRDFAPKRFELCPLCQSPKSILENNKRTCQNCLNVWKPKKDCCPHCYSDNSVAEPRVYEAVETSFQQLSEIEKNLTIRMRELVRLHPAWEWAKDVKGLGEISFAKIISKTDFGRVPTVSKFWSHCGFGLKDGQSQKLVAGKKIDYDKKLKSACYNMGVVVLMKKGSYYRFYVEQKEELLASGKVKTLIHAHNRAFKEMLKLLLSHIWQVAREAEGLPAPQPYAFAILKHDKDHFIAPEEMTEPKR